nr:AAA family ATPase [Actinopolymorpha rutila]
MNGPFGAGKTSTATELVRLLPKSRIFDSEQVGFMLGHVLTTERVADFQDHPPWRPLVAQTAIQLLRYVGGTLVVPQTVVVQEYAREIFDALAAEGVKVRHFVLDAKHDELVRRIEHDTELPQAKEWRLRRLADYQAALPWLRTSATVVDTNQKAPTDVATEIIGRLENA